MIELLCGNIASGKSRFATLRARQGAVICGGDSQTLAIHGGQYDLYDPTLRDVYKGWESSLIHLAHAAGRDVVIDRLCHSRDQRLYYIAVAKRLGTQVVCVEFDWATPAEHAGRRFKADARGYTFDRWLRVARETQDKYQKPTEAEGLDNIVPAVVAEQMVHDGSWATPRIAA
jgi:predicted kinase